MLGDSYNCSYLLHNFIDLKTFILICLFIIALSAFICLKYFKDSPLGYVGFFLIIIGGSINTYFWGTRGCVRDYLNFFDLFYFNVQDTMVTSGIFFVLISLWKKK